MDEARAGAERLAAGVDAVEAQGLAAGAEAQGLAAAAEAQGLAAGADAQGLAAAAEAQGLAARAAAAAVHAAFAAGDTTYGEDSTLEAVATAAAAAAIRQLQLNRQTAAKKAICLKLKEISQEVHQLCDAKRRLTANAMRLRGLLNANEKEVSVLQNKHMALETRRKELLCDLRRI